ncbi:trichohyalin-like [Amblyraja radiata]|uniref:trichohyalin-like n=1 Tax=Amblyraja radiata TaxID=386614 RepID=UPI001402077C|nr:trichohyalin-like [Amblyraja radiata]
MGTVKLTPETGVWSIGRDGDGLDALTSPLPRLHARPIPGRVTEFTEYNAYISALLQHQVKSSLQYLIEKKLEFEDMERLQKGKISGVREQSRNHQSFIASQFVELRQILTEKEQRFLRDLRENEERILNHMEENLRMIQENLNSIHEELSRLQEHADQKDSLLFLKEEADCERRVRDDDWPLSVRDDSIPFENFNHLFLLETVLKEMFDSIEQGKACRLLPDQVKSSLQSLTKKKLEFEDVEQLQKGKISGVREQSRNHQSFIASQFVELRQFLTEKEQRFLRDLREDEKRILNHMEENLRMIQENLNTIQEELSRLQEQADQKDSLLFLKGEADCKRRGSRALSRLSEKARTLSLKTEEKESKLHCEEHQEELKLFCETDKKLICLICRDAREHKTHNFMPIKEAVEMFKDQVKSSLQSLTKKKLEFEDVEQQQKGKISGVWEQSRNHQSFIASQFVELRQFLTEKEQRFLRDLREDEERILNHMEENLRMIQENLNSIQEELSRLQEQADQKDSLLFLKGEADCKRRVRDDQRPLSVRDDSIPFEKFNHLFLLKTVLKETFDSIKQVSVTLDVETAHSQLEVSEDRLHCQRTVARTGDIRAASALTGNTRKFPELKWLRKLSWTEDAVCPICLDFFADPVILECEHNFCRSCITRCWDGDGRNSCPECREEFAESTLRVNRALANMSEKARTASPKVEREESKLHCEEHQEELKLFCETDQQLICLICRDSREHRDHLFMPIKEAVEIYKEQIKTSFETLTKNESAMEEMEQQQKQKISGVREQSHDMLTHITSIFAELRQIIDDKERLFHQELREEEASVLHPMENNLRAIQEKLNSIREQLLKIKERMNQTDSLIFLKEETRQKRRVSDEIQRLSVADGSLAVGKFDHPFLLKTVFSEDVDGITKVSVTLDVETAGSRGVRIGETLLGGGGGEESGLESGSRRRVCGEEETGHTDPGDWSLVHQALGG